MLASIICPYKWYILEHIVKCNFVDKQETSSSSGKISKNSKEELTASIYEMR